MHLMPNLTLIKGARVSWHSVKPGRVGTLLENQWGHKINGVRLD